MKVAEAEPSPKALTDAERKVYELQTELESLRQIQNRMFQVPPIKWISERINQIAELLEQNTTKSALALREVLGPITLEAKYPDIGKPYYAAHSSLDALAIINSQSKHEELGKGSSVLRRWARSQRLRTLAKFDFHMELLPTPMAKETNFQN